MVSLADPPERNEQRARQGARKGSRCRDKVSPVTAIVYHISRVLCLGRFGNRPSRLNTRACGKHRRVPCVRETRNIEWPTETDESFTFPCASGSFATVELRSTAAHTRTPLHRKRWSAARLQRKTAGPVKWLASDAYFREVEFSVSALPDAVRALHVRIAGQSKRWCCAELRRDTELAQ